MNSHILVQLGWERFGEPELNSIHLVVDNEPEFKSILNYLVNYPHAFIPAKNTEHIIGKEEIMNKSLKAVLRILAVIVAIIVLFYLILLISAWV